MYLFYMIEKLTPENRTELKDLHRQEHGRRFADRIKTILLLDDGLSYSRVADILLLDDQTIRNYEGIFFQHGISELLKTPYKGGLTNLSVEQEVALKEHVTKNTYSLSNTILEYVKHTYGLEFSNSGMVHLFERIGFVYNRDEIGPR